MGNPSAIRPRPFAKPPKDSRPKSATICVSLATGSSSPSNTTKRPWNKLEVTNLVPPSSLSGWMLSSSPASALRVCILPLLSPTSPPPPPMARRKSKISNVEVKTPSQPIYEVNLVSKADVPRVSNRWATNQLIEEALNLILRSEIQYGFENSQKERINLQSTMVKSQQQKESVRRSPEFQRCQQMEQEGRKLTNVCEFSRHQAASIDEIKAEIQFPHYITRSGLFCKAADIVKFVFLGQMWEEESS